MKSFWMLFKKFNSYCDISVTQVDKHIRRLDCDLGRFEAEIQERAEKQTDVTSQHIGATTRRKLQGLKFS